jgi:type I restriction enzyme R subunit
MSVLLEEAIRQRKAAAISYEEHLKRVAEITKMAKKPETATEYPVNINTKAKRALFDNLGRDEGFAIALDKKIKKEAPSGWRDNKIKKRLMLSLIKEYIADENVAEEILLLVEKQEEY